MAHGAGTAERPLLDCELEAGQAVIRYLYHSGWAAQTRNHLLIFDYTEPLPPPGRTVRWERSVRPRAFTWAQPGMFRAIIRERVC